MKIEYYPNQYFDMQAEAAPYLSIEWRLRIVARNGKTMASGEGYTSKYNVKRAAKRLRGKNDWPIIEVKE